MEFVDSSILNLLVLGTSIAKHVNAAAARYRVLIYLIFLVRTDSVLFTPAELGLRLNVVMVLLRIFACAVRLIRRRRIRVNFGFRGVKIAHHSPLRKGFGVLGVHLNLPLFLALLYSLLCIYGRQSDVGLFVSENEIWDGPLLPAFVKNRLLSDFEQI